VKKQKAKPRARTERRARERATEKLAAEREKLFLLDTGGSPERPIEVASASVVESHARGIRCPRCGENELEVLEHLAKVVEGIRLREARMQCRRCGSRRSIWFRLMGPSLH
jgi:DNA-directed RNA polymerase subunit RPC12/RpoP